MTPSQHERTPQAVRDCHELLASMIPQLDRFPRARRQLGASRAGGGT
jgi:hypothetical protein